MLASTVPARFAYLWSDGTPRVVPTWFHWDGHDLVLGTLPKAPKLVALSNGASVALTIDSTDWPYHVLSIRGTANVERVAGVFPEYAAAANRYLGEEGGRAWVDQLPADVQLGRITVTPTWANVIDFETRFPSALGAG